MSQFIDSLEPRRLLSATAVTKATLLTDEAHVVADAAAAKADLKSLSATFKADTKAIQTALKGLPKTNAPLFKALKAAEARLLGLISKDLAALTGPAGALAKRGSAAGVALIAKGSAANQAKVTADVAAMGTITNAPLSKLNTDEQNSNLDADLQALAAANPSATSLIAALTQQSNDIQTQGAIFSSATVQFQTDLGTLAADLAATPAGPTKPTGSTLPNVVGTYHGLGTQTAGGHVGRSQAVTVVISTEGVDGSLTGSITVTQSNQNATFALTGTITAGGQFHATFTDDSSTTSTMTGTASAKLMKGTYSSTKDSGTFRLTK